MKYRNIKILVFLKSIIFEILNILFYFGEMKTNKGYFLKLCKFYFILTSTSPLSFHLKCFTLKIVKVKWTNIWWYRIQLKLKKVIQIIILIKNYLLFNSIFCLDFDSTKLKTIILILHVPFSYKNIMSLALNFYQGTYKTMSLA